MNFLRQCWPIGEVSYRFESIQAHVWEEALFPITPLKFKKHERVIKKIFFYLLFSVTKSFSVVCLK
jgi:hypothetical protein